MGRWIIRQWQHRPHPARFLWHWAKRAKGPKGARDRWRALTLFAYRKEKAALEAGNNNLAHHWHETRLIYRRKYRRKRKWLKQHHHQNKPPPSQGNFVTTDGHQVPRWIYEQALDPARKSGVWKGVVISGFRTPAYSTSLCEAMCGHPTCPGQCAGANSNHSCPPSHTGVAHEGAVDVSDPWGLTAWVSQHGYPIRHVLPNDANHFSASGQ